MGKTLIEAITTDEKIKEKFLELQKKLSKEQFDNVVAFAKDHGFDADEEEMKKVAYEIWKSGKLLEAIKREVKA